MDLKICLLVFVFRFLEISGNPIAQFEEDFDEFDQTEICDQRKLDDHWTDQEVCYLNAELVVIEALSNQEDIESIKRAICTSITAKYQCILDNASTCYTEKENENIKFNFLDREFEKAFNSTEVFGNAFIESCPILKSNEEKLVAWLTQSTACDYFQFQDSYLEYQQCQRQAELSKDNKMELLQFIDNAMPFYIQNWCHWRTDRLACLEPYKKCLSQGVAENARSSVEELITDIEDFIIEQDLPGFEDFQSSCDQTTAELDSFEAVDAIVKKPKRRF